MMQKEKLYVIKNIIKTTGKEIQIKLYDRFRYPQTGININIDDCCLDIQNRESQMQKKKKWVKLCVIVNMVY